MDLVHALTILHAIGLANLIVADLPRSLVKAHIVLLSAAAHEPDAALSSVRVDGSLYGRAGLTCWGGKDIRY